MQQQTPEQLLVIANSYIKLGKGVKKSIDELLQPPFTLKEVWLVLKTLVNSAESLYIGIDNAGDKKHMLVAEVWKQLDEQYNIIEVLKRAINCPFWLKPILGILLRAFVDILINLIVWCLNYFDGWFK